MQYAFLIVENGVTSQIDMANTINNKKTFRAWAFYDWANSVYSLCIGTAVFPIYYSAITNPDGIENTKVAFMGYEVNSGSLLSWTLSASFLVVVLLSPILSGIADYTNKKKFFMKCFVWLGSLSCMSLFFFTSLEHLWIGLLFSFLASVGFAGSLVFYNAFLPEIATPEHHDNLSARGFSLGYWGSVILLALIIVALQLNDKSEFMDTGFLTRCSFVLVGVWWLGFSHMVFPKLPDGVSKPHAGNNMVASGIKELRKAFKDVTQVDSAKNFLRSFFFYSMGVQTVIYVAGLYSKEALDFESSALIGIILLIQLVASGGAFFFAWISSKMGNIKTLTLQICIWVIVCVLAFLVTVETRWLFYVVAALLGLVLGGIQSLSRATYSKLLPDSNDNASFFSFYEITEKVGIVIGTASFGLVSQLAGGMRNGILALAFFFVVSLFFIVPLLKKNRKTITP